MLYLFWSVCYASCFEPVGALHGIWGRTEKICPWCHKDIIYVGLNGKEICVIKGDSYVN